MYPLKQSTAITVPFFVHDVNGDAVTGLSDGSFTKTISKDGGSLGAMTVTITELATGWYSIPVSTSHSDTLGILTVVMTNAGAKQVNLQFRVSARISDDMAFPTTTGRSLDVAADGAIEVVDLLTGHTVQTGDSFTRLGAPVAASISADVAVVDANVDTLITRITSTIFSGITSLAEWLGLLAGKQAADATALTEIKASGAGSGTYDETTDSHEAIRDTAPLGTAMRGTDSAALASVLGAAVGADISADVAAVKVDTAATVADTVDIQGRLPAALVGGAMDSDVSNIQTDKVDAGALAADAVTEIQSGLATAAALTTVDGVVDDILTDTAVIGAAGAGLTALPWNAAWDAEVESEVNDALDTAISELAQGKPVAGPTLRTGLMLLYMALRNRLDVTTSGSPDVLAIYNDAGTIIAKKQLTDDGNDYSEAEIETGP